MTSYLADLALISPCPGCFSTAQGSLVQSPRTDGEESGAEMPDCLREGGMPVGSSKRWYKAGAGGVTEMNVN